MTTFVPGSLDERTPEPSTSAPLPIPPDPSIPSEPSEPSAGGGSHWWIRTGRPAWSVPARAAIFVSTLVLYTWNLSAVGMSNTFYAAAVKSGTVSWKAFFFGSLDPGNFITVDKPPAALWVEELSGRVFGFSSWSMLLPEALAGVACVMIVYRLVRRWAGEPAAVFGAVALAVTPIATEMFRDNNPDAMLTLLLVAAAWALWSALETAKTNRLVICATLVGFAFLTKTLEAFIVLPAFGLVYLVCAKPRLPRRLAQLGLGRAGVGDRQRVVGRHRRALAGRLPTVYRRQYRQLGMEPHLRLQRLLPDHRLRWRDRCPRRRRRRIRREPGHPPDVQRPDRRADLLAAAAGRGGPGRRAVVHPEEAPGQPAARRLRVVGRLDPDVRGGVLRRQGDLPPVLHRGPGARGGRPLWRRFGGAVAARTIESMVVLGIARRGDRYRGVGGDPARAHPGVRHLAGAGRRDHRCGRRGLPLALGDRRGPGPDGGGCRRRARSCQRVGRSRRLLVHHREQRRRRARWPVPDLRPAAGSAAEVAFPDSPVVRPDSPAVEARGSPARPGRRSLRFSRASAPTRRPTRRSSPISRSIRAVPSIWWR